MDLRSNHKVKIPVNAVELNGNLVIPANAHAIVVFSHGSGSSRMSPRNLQVARHLHQHHLGTLLFDLLTEEEDIHYNNRFNINLLTERLMAATDWLLNQPAARDCRLGYFGASTGAASALKASARSGNIGAVVSRGGRPDLAMDELPQVQAPVLLIVGSLDHDVLQLNRRAYELLKCEKKLDIIEGATHLFEEEGMMEIVSEKATNWFQQYLQPVKA